jgi:cyclase
MSRTLIVARLDPAHAPMVAKLFEESDGTRLPHSIGVRRRTLFTFHDLYFHLVEAGDDLARRLSDARRDPLYTELNDKLSQYITPYSATWREPKDAMATPFYSWRADD